MTFIQIPPINLLRILRMLYGGFDRTILFMEILTQ